MRKGQGTLTQRERGKRTAGTIGTRPGTARRASAASSIGTVARGESIEEVTDDRPGDGARIEDSVDLPARTL